MNAIRELDHFNAGYDAGKDGADVGLLLQIVKRTMPRPDQAQAEAMVRAGYEYYLLECDALDDGARLPYRP